MVKATKGPQFVRFIPYVVEALRVLGGSGRPIEVKDLIAAELHIPEDELNEQIESGESRFAKNVAWSRFYLAKAGYIDASERGVWSLTERGLNASLSHQDALEIFRFVRTESNRESDTAGTSVTYESSPVSTPEIESIDHRTLLLNLLKELPPAGFERFCQRLLRESGFQKVIVTGRSGDGGLDGNGVLQVNPFVSFQVYFQCKRYSGTVSASVVRDFRGAMVGRTDKGIIITTGAFSGDARREAVRDGAPPIELVDGEKLIDMLETLKLGLKPREIYEIDDKFFDEFKNDR